MQELYIGGGGPSGGESRDPRERWWYQDDEYQLASRLLATADAIDTRTRSRQLGILDRLVRLYGDLASVPDSVPLVRRGRAEERRPIAANVCDTLGAEISKDRPRPMFVTHGGSWDQQRTAERLTAGCDWKFGRELMVSKGRRAAIDSMVAGAGFIRPVAQLDGCVTLERCFPCDVLMDDAACVDEMPRDIYHRRFVDRAMLWELYPDAKMRRMIEDAEPAGWCLTNPHSASSDVVELIEGWHLPSYQGEIDGRAAKDGHWALVLRTGSAGGGLLDSGPYTRPHHVIVGMRSIKPSRGWWGLPLIDRIAASALELNKIMRRIAEMMHRNATNRTWLQQGSQVSPAEVQNTIGAIIYYAAGKQPPIFEAPNPVNPGVFDYCDRLESYGHKDAGVSQYAASSTIPANLESGRAQRIFREQQTLRQVDIFDEYEDLHCRLARRWAEAEAEQAENDPGRETPFEIDGCAERIRWAQVTAQLDSMAITPKPTSGLAATPAARMQDIQDGVKDGTFTTEDALRLSTDPDLKSLREERLAPLNRLHKVLDGMLDGGPYVPPDFGEMDLARGIQLCLAKINAAVVRECPPERIDSLRRWWPEAQAKLDQAQAAAAPPPPEPGLPLPEAAAGASLPGAELLPEAPGLPPAELGAELPPVPS